MKSSALQTIFFDFDGVILDSTKIKTETFRLMYQAYGDEIVKNVINHHLQHGGISRVEKIRFYHSDFLKQPLSDEALETLCTEFSNRVKDQVVAANWISGAEAFLKSHYDLYPLYIVSGTPQEEMTEIAEKRRLNRYFKEILGSPIKKPEHVHRVMKEQGFEPQRCLFVGDAMTDLLAARDTGIHFIGIQGDITFPPETIVLPDCRNLAAQIEMM